MAKDKKISGEKTVEKENLTSDCLTLTLALLLLIFIVSFLWPRNEITKAKLAVGRWPLSFKKHLLFSETLFNNNKEGMATEELERAKSLYQTFSFLDFSQKAKKKFLKTEELITQPEKIRQQINSWETVLKSKPHSRDILLHLTVLNYQLWQDEKAQDYWQKAFYLDPNNSLVQQVGQIISQ